MNVHAYAYTYAYIQRQQQVQVECTSSIACWCVLHIYQLKEWQLEWPCLVVVSAVGGGGQTH